MNIEEMRFRGDDIEKGKRDRCVCVSAYHTGGSKQLEDSMKE